MLVPKQIMQVSLFGLAGQLGKIHVSDCKMPVPVGSDDHISVRDWRRQPPLRLRVRKKLERKFTDHERR